MNPVEYATTIKVFGFGLIALGLAMIALVVAVVTRKR